MSEIKAYIIDSNVLVRQTLVNIIRKVNGASFFGSSVGISFDEIIDDIRDKNPDVLFLGINEEKSKESRLFYRLRQVYPTLPIVIITPINKEGAHIALSCLKNGAIDFVTKPMNNGRLIFAKEHFAKRIVPIIKMIDRLNIYREVKAGSVVSKSRKPRSTKENYSTFLKRLTSQVELVVIGGCTGGVRSLFSVLSAMPKQIAAPIIVVQHMPKLYSKKLAQELDQIARVSVREAKNGQILRPGQVYVVPGGYHAALKNEGVRKTICLHRGPREENSRPSLNVLLRSASQVYRDRLLGVFLSGGGEDGLLGARNIADKGGQVMIENKESALLWDLPKKLDDQGISIESYPAELLGQEISRLIAINPSDKSVRKLKKPISNYILPTGQL